MRPGTLSICSTCRHQARDMAAAGHPSPCCRQRWDGPALHVPEISAAGCAEFEAAELPDLAEAEEVMG